MAHRQLQPLIDWANQALVAANTPGASPADQTLLLQKSQAMSLIAIAQGLENLGLQGKQSGH
jgi:hypothetical protein